MFYDGLPVQDLVIILSVFAVCIVTAIAARIASWPRETACTLEHVEGHRRLVVLVPGILSRGPFGATIELVRESLPQSDLLLVNYDGRVLSNADPYAVANVIEHEVHEAFKDNRYEEIVLVGHSMGGMLLRKALVWGNGLEEDRTGFGQKGERPWVRQVSRFVSLATINRGWSIQPAPKNMQLGKRVLFCIGDRFGRLTGTGQLLLKMKRGAPFIADSRVQWIALCRGAGSQQRNIPQTIHLLGDKDDIVSQEDSKDLSVAKSTVFVTLTATGHEEIAVALRGGTSPSDMERRRRVGLALQGKLDALDPDTDKGLVENSGVDEIVYVMHGIRDWGEWTDCVRSAVEAQASAANACIAVVNRKYGHFPMAPFLLYWDRQKYVRIFMDEYTENRALYPKAQRFYYVGHSNGTYILAGALERYKSLNVHRVFFAGSVVPKHYPWRALADAGRVVHLANVVAAGDWVVAIFPRLFEQIGEWMGLAPVRGALDIGSGGFRGFLDAADPQKRIENVQFAAGAHSTGVDVRNAAKVQTIARYIVSGDTAGFVVFRNRQFPEGWLSFASNISWAVWLVLLGIVGSVGWVAFNLCPWAWVGWVYVALVLALLNSV